MDIKKKAEQALEANSRLLLDEVNGKYIPQLFCSIYQESAVNSEKLQDCISDCLEGPENECYWDSWDSIIDEMQLELDGEIFMLYENGSLWAINQKINDLDFNIWDYCEL